MLSFKGAEEGGAVSTDKIDVSRKPAMPTLGETPNTKKSKKKKKGTNSLTPPPQQQQTPSQQMMNSMVALTSGVSPRGIDNYSLQPTLLNQHMSLPIIKSEQNDNDPKVCLNLFEKNKLPYNYIFSVNVVVHLKQNLPMDLHQ